MKVRGTKDCMYSLGNIAVENWKSFTWICLHFGQPLSGEIRLDNIITNDKFCLAAFYAVKQMESPAFITGLSLLYLCLWRSVMTWTILCGWGENASLCSQQDIRSEPSLFPIHKSTSAADLTFLSCSPRSCKCLHETVLSSFQIFANILFRRPISMTGTEDTKERSGCTVVWNGLGNSSLFVKNWYSK